MSSAEKILKKSVQIRAPIPPSWQKRRQLGPRARGAGTLQPQGSVYVFWKWSLTLHISNTAGLSGQGGPLPCEELAAKSQTSTPSMSCLLDEQGRDCSSPRLALSPALLPTTWQPCDPEQRPQFYPHDGRQA